jgi:hypothetical protein
MASLAAGACEAGDVQLAKEFITQWAVDHAGEIAVHKLGYESGNDYVDAAVDGYEVIDKLQQADTLMARGRANSDTRAMDKALELRPHDWSYELSRANLALQKNDIDTYDKFEAGAMTDSSGRPMAAYEQEYRELVNVHKNLYGRGSYDSYYQCERLYSKLGLLTDPTAHMLPPGTVSAEDQQLYQDRYARCESLPR